MLVEERTYTTHPGKWRDYLALYEAEGLAIQRRILGRMVGYYHTDIGELNQIVHLWAYEDLNERAERRARLMQDPGFRSYVARMLPLLQSQSSRILLPAPFFEPLWHGA
ncbi:MULTISPECIES: NIPSNAP family protein [unclassified Variovorax]|uniref:NIPSNAP family protein n=1 Tax=unclassified Variovorax TaxID=663243 RepID=UPI0008D55F56|nr:MULTISPECIES: NIPSNAP family protein [unclassified Variovorax]SEK12561.1 NIPSNAP protein [Variovorax sp. OK202]SFD82295.1 NIPSNAP protein [Variovorax sp. OK212]